ncbi:putative exported protein [Leminorella grimontii ATCC 33999 = DSM 5078]|nr:putative exported protein [Leminorella grimontii ATCC 33999 = DSM 5078]
MLLIINVGRVKMRLTSVIKTAVGGLLLLSASQAIASADDLAVKYVSIPTWNIITDTLNEMTPKLEGKRDDFLMKQVCDLARGDVTQQQVNVELSKRGINARKIPTSGSPWSLLVNGNLKQQQAVCTAYLASSMFQPVNTRIYLENAPKPAVKEKKEEKEPSGWTFWKSDNKENAGKNAVSQNEQVFNLPRFNKDMHARMAVAQSTAQLYAVIAANISDSTPLTWPEYQQRVIAIVNNYGAEYLRSIDMFYASGLDKPILARSIEDNGYTIEDNEGNRLIQSDANPQLISHGVTWFGNGRILGNDYFVNMTVIGSSRKDN